MPYEGTPPLWHFILHPFAAGGAPYALEFIINYIFSAGAVFLLLFFSPLPKAVKILLPFSFYFIFEYSIVARNYSLIILSLFIIATLYKERFRRPLLYAATVIIMAWSGIQGFATAALLALFFIIEALKNKHEEKRYLAAIIFMLLGLLGVILILIPYPDQLYAGLKFNGFDYLARAVASSLLPYFSDLLIPSPYLWIVSAAWLALIPLFIRGRVARTILAASFLWMLFIIAFKNSGYLRHYGLFLMMFIFSWWLDSYYATESVRLSKERRKLLRLAAVTFLLSCLTGAAAYGIYYRYINRDAYYSGAKEMAAYLINNNLVDEEVAAYPAIAGSALLPYLPHKKFYQMELAYSGTFLTWNDIFKYSTLFPYWEHKKTLWQYYNAQPAKPKSVLILSTWPLGQYDRSLIFLSENTKRAVTDEHFYLYRYFLPQ